MSTNTAATHYAESSRRTPIFENSRYSAGFIARTVSTVAAHLGVDPRAVMTSPRRRRHPEHIARILTWHHLTECGMERTIIAKAWGKGESSIRAGIRMGRIRGVQSDHAHILRTLPHPENHITHQTPAGSPDPSHPRCPPRSPARAQSPTPPADSAATP